MNGQDRGFLKILKKDHGGCRSQRARGGQGGCEGVEVRHNKLSNRQREEVKRYVRSNGSWAKDGSRVIDPSPLWLPSGCVSASACMSVCACVFVSLKQHSRPPCAQTTTGCRSESLERGLPLNEFPVHPGVTHESPLPCSPCNTNTPTPRLLLRPPGCLINNAFSRQGPRCHAVRSYPSGTATYRGAHR